MKQFSPTEAHTFLQSHPEAVFIDCRSEIEYLFVGHPVGAIHIAWQDGPDWDVNPDFLGHSRKAASANRPVVLICRSGGVPPRQDVIWRNMGFPRSTTSPTDSRATWTGTATAAPEMAGNSTVCRGSRPSGLSDLKDAKPASPPARHR